MSSLKAAIPGLTALLFAASLNAAAAEFWTGPRITFSKTDAADPLQPVNQDRITEQVWMTRAASGGIFNARTESGYDFAGSGSPAGTAWAFDRTIADGVEGVQFQPWAQAANRNPPATVGVNAVMHLIAEDIYIDVTFTSWQINCCGGFSYERTTPAVPVELVAQQQVPALPWPLAALLGGLLVALARRYG